MTRMAEGEGSKELETDDKVSATNGEPSPKMPKATAPDDAEDEEEEEEEEPRLKYAPLTKNLTSLYRNGDASSAFLVAGDKMVVGTHNGNIHTLSLPAFQSLRVYHAHTASISSISISPFPPPLPTVRSEPTRRAASEVQGNSEGSPTRSKLSPGAKNSPKQPSVPNTPSNQIYIATSSIDGNVCVSSLVDSNDVQLRNFGRPVQAVALSPEYRSDRNYLSGGQAGNLILTTGGQAGRSVNATTTSTAAAASGWLGSIGLGSNTGTDKVLHSGEGIISTIKWSLSGKYVLWVNEQGIKIMRSNLHLESADAAFEWKRMSHKDKPTRDGWEDMTGVWKARAEWFDRDNLEVEEEPTNNDIRAEDTNGKASDLSKQSSKKNKYEEVVVGWGDTVWLFRVHPGGIGTGKEAGERKIGRVEVVKILQNDCIVSGVSLYTPNLLLVLAYIESEGNPNNQTALDTPTRKGRHHRQIALEPELRLIDLTTQEEVSNDTLSISRFESLSASDYHLSVLPPIKITPELIQQGALGAIGSGLGTIGSGLYSGVGTVGSGLFTGVETVGQGVWDATMFPTRMLGANRLFSSGGSVRSGSSKVAEEKAGSTKTGRYLSGWLPGFSLPGFGTQSKEVTDVGATLGMKIFICSPYDCVAAVRRNIADKLQWLIKMERYDDAWHILDEHPEAVGTISDTSEASSPPTASKASSTATGPTQQRATTGLADFFADASSVASPAKAKGFNSAAEKEKRRIGELWLQQIIAKDDWRTAGEVAGKVLGTTSRWEHWTWLFIRNKKFDEIAYVVPTLEITPPLPSLIYEFILGNYVSSDRPRFQQLLDLWPSDLFDIGSITTAIEDQINNETAPKDSTDWRILQECLAKLFLAGGRYDDALRAYIRLQDADTALSMVKDHHLLDAVADDIPELVLLRISPEQLRTASNEVLEDLSSDPIKLLVDEATTGVVQPERVVVQLEESSLLVFLFFYLRALWRGEGSQPKVVSKHRFGHTNASANLAADEGKILVEQFADTAVELFADFDRDLLMEFLHYSTAYTFDKAVRVCEHRHFIPELVYLLSKTGQTKKALFLIIDELNDVVQAISFVKDQKDDDLWEDLLEYSMSRPKFISALLAEVGTAINPISLVKRIPSGLEIEGLKDGLKKMIREYDLQDSISTGVAKVLQGEVAVGMEKLRKGRRKGIKFDVTAGGRRARSRERHAKADTKTNAVEEDAIDSHEPAQPTQTPGHCSGCGEAFIDDETETLVGFACGHIYHLSHLLHDPASSQPPSSSPEGFKDAADDDEGRSTTFTRTIGPKVTNARLLRYKIEAVGGCGICKARKAKEAEV